LPPPELEPTGVVEPAYMAYEPFRYGEVDIAGPEAGDMSYREYIWGFM
jgi:hypothetical protein